MAKGSSFEREICKELSLWYTGGERDDIFWRTSISGGRATQRAKSGKKTAGSCGDVAAIDPIGEPFVGSFSIELKRGYTSSVDILDLLDSKKKLPTMAAFFLQAEEDRIKADKKYTMVIFKRDMKRKCIMFCLNSWWDIFSDQIDSDNDAHVIYFGEPPFVVMRLEDFFRSVKPKDVLEAL